MLLFFQVLKSQSSTEEKDNENIPPSSPNHIEMNEIRRSAAKTSGGRPKINRNTQINDNNDNSACESEQHFSSTRNTAAPRTRRLRSSSTDVSSVKSDEEEEDRVSDAGYVETPAITSPGLSPMSAFNEDRMRRRLQFFFMNPIEKWQAKRRFPYKFVVQVSQFSDSFIIQMSLTWIRKCIIIL